MQLFILKKNSHVFVHLRVTQLIQRLTVRTDPLKKHAIFIETKDASVIKVILLKEFAARLMILRLFCTAEPNPALVSGAELDLTEFTEQDCEGQYRVYSGMQYSHISAGI